MTTCAWWIERKGGSYQDVLTTFLDFDAIKHQYQLSSEIFQLKLHNENCLILDLHGGKIFRFAQSSSGFHYEDFRVFYKKDFGQYMSVIYRSSTKGMLLHINSYLMSSLLATHMNDKCSLWLVGNCTIKILIGSSLSWFGKQQIVKYSN